MLKNRGLAIAGLTAGAAACAIINRVVSSSTSVAVKVIPRGNKLGNSIPKQLSIVSYNVLCDRFSTSSKLPHVASQFLSFDYRWQHLARELAEFDSDIICLQEAPLERWDDLRGFMADLGYDCLQQQKPHEVKLAIFWRCSTLTLAWSEERSRALLTEMTLLNNTNNTAAINNSSTMSYPQTTTLYIINVHLEGSPYRASDRVSQLRHALHRLEYHLEATGRDIATAKVILVGDFNSTSTDSPSKFLKQGFLEAGYTDPLPVNQQQPATDHDIYHHFNLQDVYEISQSIPPFTRKVQHRTGARLDLIWATTSGLEVEAVMRPLPLEHRELVERIGLPNYALPSDHLPVGAVFRIVEEESSSIGAENKNGNAKRQNGEVGRVSIDTNTGGISESDE
jgi:CCR4-NOT transcription complex subunit 6